MGYRFGADIGGTFTDLVLIGDDGTCRTKKVLSTPRDYGQAVVEGFRVLLAESGVAPGSIAQVAHATTVATNAVLERKGARAGLITTRGFRDVLELRRMRFPEPYNLFWEKPRPLIDRYLRLEVTERMSAQGDVITPLDVAEVTAALRRLVEEEEIESLAVSLLNSYVNPVHEQMIGELARALYPDLPLSLSADVLPEMKEYERTSTTALNAYLMPVVATYLGRLEEAVAGLGIEAPLLVMQSNGGIMTARAARRHPVHILESGPAAGVVGAAEVARVLGISDLVTFDMGGTTAKGAMIEGGEPFRAPEYEVGAPISVASRVLKGGGYLLRVPAIDVAEVGAGGGSIVYLDSGGALHVGPRSAGADPGPVCYDRGGVEPTVTDANLVLGYLNQEALLGGDLPIDLGKARQALSGIAETIRLPLLETAYGVFQIANASMMRTIRAVSTERGRDVRQCVLMVFGGNGPVHAAEMARSLGIGRVVIPPAPGVFSALGLLYADVERHYLETRRIDIRQADLAEVRDAFAKLEAQALAELAQEGWDGERIRLRRYADLHYRGQSFELRVPVSGGAIGDDVRQRIEEDFHTEHARTYGHRQDDERVELVNVRVIASVQVERPRLPEVGGAAVADPVRRPAYFGPQAGLLDTPVVTRSHLIAQRLQGPLIVEEYDTTVVVPPGCSASADSRGIITLEVGR